MSEPRLFSRTIFGTSAGLLILFALIGLVGFSIAARLLADAVEGQARADIAADLHALQRRVDTLKVVAVADAIDFRLSQTAIEDGPLLYALAWPDGRLITGNLAEWPLAMPDSDGWVTFQHGRPAASTVARIVRVAGDFRLLVGRELRAYDGFRRKTTLIVAATLGGVLLAGMVVGLVVSRRMLHRLRSVNAVFRAVEGGQVDARVAFGGRDEFGALARHVNDALETIERSLTGMRSLSGVIAHELRRHLTAVQDALIETTAPGDRGRERALTLLDDLQALFDGLLEIANMETQVRAPIDRVAIDAVVDEAIELYREAAGERGLGLERGGTSGNVLGDHWLLLRLVANLLDNAIRHSPSGTTVRIGTALHEGRVTVEIADEGLGVGGRTLDEVIADRQLGPLRPEPDATGHGLGLRIVRAITLRHGGTITVRDRDPGLCVTVAFPQG